jgi:hypothetical protein
LIILTFSAASLVDAVSKKLGQAVNVLCSVCLSLTKETIILMYEIWSSLTRSLIMSYTGRINTSSGAVMLTSKWKKTYIYYMIALKRATVYETQRGFLEPAMLMQNGSRSRETQKFKHTSHHFSLARRHN